MIETQMIEYQTATKLAAHYKAAIGQLRALLPEIGVIVRKLNEAFSCEQHHTFDLYVNFERHHGTAYEFDNDKMLEQLEHEFRLSAWRVLVNKTGIRKLMSSKRAAQLDKLLETGKCQLEDGTTERLPDISDGSIMEVLTGFLGAVDSFLTEAVREEWEYWKPRPNSSHYKTNQGHEFCLQRKIIAEHGFRTWKYGNKSELSGLHESTQRHLTALDNIMHLLDGKGMVKGYHGPLVDAINGVRANKSDDRIAETDYFRAKWFLNGNLHLEFKRQDLLDRFNEINSSNMLAQAKTA